MSSAAANRILIVGPSWVGDMVMAQSLFKVLHQQQPAGSEALQLDVLAPAWSRPILERMPEVNAAIDLPLAHGELGLKKRYTLGRALRAQQYRRVIVLPNSLKSALIPWFARIPQRTGWRGEQRGLLLNDCRVLDKQRYPLMVQRFVALALPAQATLSGELPEPLPVPQLISSRQSAQQAILALGLGWTADTAVLALCPGAEFGDAKQWPAEHYAEVARVYCERGWRVALMGSAKDQAVCQQIIDQLPPELQAHCDNLAGRTSLAQAIDLMSLARAVVSNDSGLMHIAAALHRPVVAVYGSTSPDFTPPLSDRVQLLHTDISCRPCFKRQCPYGHKRCLTDLQPQQVLQALHQLLGGVQMAEMTV